MTFSNFFSRNQKCGNCNSHCISFDTQNSNYTNQSTYLHPNPNRYIKRKIEKTNTYCAKFKDTINKKLDVKVFMREMKTKFYTKEHFTQKRKYLLSRLTRNASTR